MAFEYSLWTWKLIEPICTQPLIHALLSDLLVIRVEPGVMSGSVTASMCDGARHRVGRIQSGVAPQIRPPSK